MLYDTINAHRLEKALGSKPSRLIHGRIPEDTQSLASLAEQLQTLPKKHAPLPAHKRRYLTASQEPVTNQGLRLINWAGYLAGATLALGLTLTTVFAMYAEPGSALYAYKHQGQELRLKFASDENARANLQIKYATSRLEETSSVLRDSEAGAEKKAAALSELTSQTEATVETVKKVALAQNDSKLLTQLEGLTSKQTEVLTTTNDPAVKAETENALKATAAGTKTIAEAKRLVAAANESAAVALPISISGTLTKVTDKTILIGTTSINLMSDTELVETKETTTKPVLKSGQHVSVTAMDTPAGLNALKITISSETIKSKPTENPKPITHPSETDIPDSAPTETAEVHSGFVIENPAPLYPQN